jgi:hypothetical protein
MRKQVLKLKKKNKKLKNSVYHWRSLANKLEYLVKYKFEVFEDLGKHRQIYKELEKENEALLGELEYYRRNTIVYRHRIEEEND